MWSRAWKKSVPEVVADRSGSVAMIVALMLPVFVFGLSIVTDVGLWRYRQRVIQGAADAAAVSAQFDVSAGRSVSQITASASREAIQNGWKGPTSGTITVHSPPTSGTLNGVAGAVEIILTERETRLFSGTLSGNGPGNLTGRAVSNVGSSTVVTTTGKGCMLALNPSIVSGILVSGGVTLSNANCEFYSNSNSSRSIFVNGGSHVSGAVQAVGTVVVTGGSTVGTSVSNAAATGDPYAGSPVPGANASSGACIESGSTQVNWGYGVSSVSPGHWCNNWNIGSGAVLNLQPGVYYLGSMAAPTGFTLSGGGTINALGGVTLVMVNLSTSSGFNINGGGALKIAAPSTGPTAGFAIAQNTDQVYASTVPYSLGGGANITFTGAIHAPAASLDVSGGTNISTTNGSAGCGQIVVDDVNVSGGVSMGNQCNLSAVKGFGSPVVTTTVVSSGGAVLSE